jgi:hypothetical protein
MFFSKISNLGQKLKLEIVDTAKIRQLRLERPYVIS